MKNKKIETKKIIHMLILAFIFLALLFGLIFSAFQASNGMKLGYQYHGNFKAIVNVSKSERSGKDDEWSLKPGDSKEGAEALQSKLSPFSDGNIQVDIAGKSRAIVYAPKELYSNNQELFKNAIQSTGGLFILNNNEDVMLNSELMTKLGFKTDLVEKEAVSKIIGASSAVSKHIGQNNYPFIQFDLQNDNLKKMITANAEQKASAPALTFLVDASNVLDTFRNYLSFATTDKDREKFIVALFDAISGIKGNIEKITDQGQKTTVKNVFNDFFTGKKWKKTTSGSWEIDKKANLFNEENSSTAEQLKTAFFADGDSNHKFAFNNDINKYIYDSNSIGQDFDSKKSGRYSKEIEYDGQKMNVTKAFNILTKYIIPVIYDETKKEIKTSFKEDLFKNNFIFSGTIKEETQQPSTGGASILSNNFFIPTKNYTTAKQVTAKIAQTTKNLIFTVMSIENAESIISTTMFIVSLTILIIIAIAIAIFILFFYRLLGLFAIIIAAIIGSLTILMSVIFSISFGPEFIAILFIVVGLSFDISIVLFESFKTNIYIEKRPLTTSFNISHKETLGIGVDVLLATILPSIILFWIGSGFLKNFATITALGLFFVFIFSIIVLRVLIYFTTKTQILNKVSWLLPIDTSVDYQGSFICHSLIEYKEKKIEAYSFKKQLSSNELIKIKKIQDQIDNLKAKNAKIYQAKLVKYEKQQQKQFEKWTKKIKNSEIKLAKISNQEKKQNFFQQQFHKHLLKKIQFLSHLTSEWDQTPVNDINKIKENKIVKLESNSKKIGIITLIITGVLLFISSLVTGLVGLNYSPNFGSGSTTYIQGNYVSEFQGQVKNGTIDFKFDENTNKEITDKLRAIDKEVENELKNLLKEGEKINPEKYSSLSVERMYRYIFAHNLLDNLSGDNNIVRMKNLKISSGPDYSAIDLSWNTEKKRPWVSFETTSDIINKSTEFRNVIYRLAGKSGNYTPDTVPTQNAEGQILVLAISPLTTFAQIKEILITIAIVLLALFVYMLIRFKWTYYVALALGIVIALALVVTIVLVFRIPFSIEILAGAMAVISFAFATGILFLGKGKSIIKSKNEEEINESFETEIDLQIKIKHIRKDLRTAIREHKNKFEEHTEDLKDKKLFKELKQAFIQEKKALIEKSRVAIYELKQEIKIESNKNKFLSEVFDKVFKFGLYRAVVISILYMLVGLVAALTLPPIAIMGVTMLVGVPVTIIVMLCIVLPIWVKLERQRIRMKYAYKKFVTKMKVSAEEQIIAGIND
ncbi:protein translocase SecDF, variant type [Williamsoniiplasma luminosum]|uniref:Protein export membrane protein SecD/SecF C-terminal domain-containing protein n=1 Tax=Williamsoniiplasma luminosum TaxID=214888 RepID=A0A2S0NJF8_9MOLU|nr:protein translocase SecDF, variant type [Williamsoniiplasma luminosum]AVP49160.1 MAG: hypothetical protein C5T88_01000 [Williamsoniiplasma luminosum]